MLGLGDYVSSDEEELAKPTKESKAEDTTLSDDLEIFKAERQGSAAFVTSQDELLQDAVPDGLTASSPHLDPGPALGPQIGPQLGPVAEEKGSEVEDGEGDSAPSSPYSSHRALIQSLTMPPYPNYEIPPSPPGSPSELSNTKVKRFLELKSKGEHFNARLAASVGLRNPAMFDSLMSLAGIEDQYASTLPNGLSPVPQGGFPAEAYADELGRLQAERTKNSDSERKGLPRVFVAAAKDTSGLGISSQDKVAAASIKEEAEKGSINPTKKQKLG